jgi:hypothetical protein
MEVVILYCVYAALSIALTVWVGQTLHRNGKLFLVEAFRGDARMAEAVNHLLRVGFYLINLGFVALFLSLGREPSGLIGAIEYISVKIGIVLLVLGAMHFFNMFNFARMRRKGLRASDAALASAPVATT